MRAYVHVGVISRLWDENESTVYRITLAIEYVLVGLHIFKIIYLCKIVFIIKAKSGTYLLCTARARIFGPSKNIYYLIICITLSIIYVKLQHKVFIRVHSVVLCHIVILKHFVLCMSKDLYRSRYLNRKTTIDILCG